MDTTTVVLLGFKMYDGEWPEELEDLVDSEYTSGGIFKWESTYESSWKNVEAE